MRSTLLIYHVGESAFVHEYRDDLELRDISCRMVPFESLSSFNGQRLSATAKAIIFSSPEIVANSVYFGELKAFVSALPARYIATVVIRPHQPRSPLNSFTQINAYSTDYDFAFEQVFRFLMGPLPEWLKVYCRPTQIRKPTGAAWWDKDDILLVDEHYNHLVKVNSRGSTVLLAGLEEPYQINIDRRLFSVSNLGTNRVIFGKIQGGVVADLREIKTVGGKKLCRPHGIFQGKDFSVIADTDNHRVIWKKGHFKDGPSRWMSTYFDLRFPCGVFADDQEIWIADTFQHRLVSVNPKTGNIGLAFGCSGIGGGEMLFPTYICRWNEYIFVTDEQNRRVQLLRHIPQGGCEVVCSAIGKGFVNSPLGLGVNRKSKLIIADHSGGCCWTVDLSAWLEEFVYSI